jgi:signal transduction histidine kinase
MHNGASNRKLTVLLVSGDTAFCEQARISIQTGHNNFPQVVAVSTLLATHRVIQEAPPTVILLHQKSVIEFAADTGARCPQFDSAVTFFAGHAPTVVIAAASFKKDVDSLVAAGAADFVEHSDDCVPVALKIVERRLRNASGDVVTAVITGAAPAQNEFGQLLRHELNNPLTGILGNAELLLAEVRRKHDDRVPAYMQQRLETIAALAVRMREAIRRLSHQVETR